jgi:hypothetical protein
VNDRTPFPFCGDASETGATAYSCFESQVLQGRPVEMLDKFAVSGGRQVLRFSGQGLVERFAAWPEGWFHDGGTLILGPSAGTWSLDNWLDRSPVTG